MRNPSGGKIFGEIHKDSPEGKVEEFHKEILERMPGRIFGETPARIHGITNERISKKLMEFLGNF